MDVISNVSNWNVYNGDCNGSTHGSGENNSNLRGIEGINNQPEVVNLDELNNSNNKNKYNKKELDKALEKVNNFLKDDKTHAEYSVHKDFGTLMIKIVDDESDKVVMELPPEKILDMIASMCKQFGLLDKKV